MINWNRRKYTKQEFIDAWNEENSIPAVARKLGLNIYGSTYSTLNDTASELGLPKKILGRGWAKGKKLDYSNQREIEYYLKNDIRVASSWLKARLIKEEYIKPVCSICQITTWNDKPAPLQLDHIDGNNRNNLLENLRILCANCHAQTDTFCGKNVKHKKNIDSPVKSPKKISLVKKHHIKRMKDKNKCIDCNCAITRTAIRCKKCYNETNRDKIIWPPIEEIIDKVKNTSYCALARELGVSDNAIRKHIWSRGYSAATLDKL